MRLFIAEKPSLGRAIANGLGRGANRDGHIAIGNNVVTWCFGHLLEQASPSDYKPEWKRWDTAHLPYVIDTWKLIPRKDAAAQLKIIKGLLASATEVVNAGDPDREGQLLVDEVLVFLGWRGKTTRLLLNATDPDSVSKALAKICDNAKYRPLYEAALCRQRADWLVGMNLTVAATKLVANDTLVSVGRVQTPTLALVVRRDLEIENFTAKSFHYVEADIEVKAGRALFSHNPTDPRILDRKVAENLAAALTGKSVPISVVRKEAKERSPLPFILATFQKAAEKKLGLGTDKALKTLQALYEAQLVSYPRTDCPYLPAEQKGDALRIAGAILALPEFKTAAHLKQLLTPKNRVYDSSKVAEHHGLIPTARLPGADLPAPLRAAWELVANNFILSLLPDYCYEETVASFFCDGKEFSAKGEVPLNLDQSWRALLPKKEKAVALPKIADKEIGRVAAVRVKDGRTTPPEHYTESSLVDDMRAVAKYVEDEKLKAILKETAGIGTAATQAATIETLKGRGYLIKNGKKIISSPFGRSIVAALPSTLCNPGVTAAWEDALGKIASSNYEPQEFMRRISVFVEKRIGEMRESKIRIVAPEGGNAAKPTKGIPKRKAITTFRSPSRRNGKRSSR